MLLYEFHGLTRPWFFFLLKFKLLRIQGESGISVRVQVLSHDKHTCMLYFRETQMKWWEMMTMCVCPCACVTVSIFVHPYLMIYPHVCFVSERHRCVQWPSHRPGWSPRLHKPAARTAADRWGSTCETSGSLTLCPRHSDQAVAGNWWSWRTRGTCATPHKRTSDCATSKQENKMYNVLWWILTNVLPKSNILDCSVFTSSVGLCTFITRD